ncbi:MAG: ceramidase [Actinobacteria bacterium]|nr:ceramidase [Actinomycetota bacterium]
MGGSDCEQIGSGWLAQPVNALSSLVYVAVGVWLLWRSRAPGVRRGPLVAGGAALLAVGVGGVAFHGWPWR